MPIVPLPNDSVINVQFFGTTCDQRIINLFQYQATGVINTGIDYTNYLNGLFDAITQAGGLFDAFQGCQGNNYKLDFIRLQPVWPQRLRFVDYPQSAFGQYTAPNVTANGAASIERFSRQGKRHGIGRVQLVLPSGSVSDGLIPVGAYKTALGVLGATMPLQLNSTSPLLVTVPVILNTALPNGVPRQVEGTNVKDTVRTMHRRTVGLGV